MTVIEQIKAEIERLKSIEYPCDNSQQETGFFNALDRMTDFLSTLESGKPIGLEEEIDKYREEHLFDMPAFQQVARHFAKWGAEHSVSSEIPAELEEAADGYAEKHGFRVPYDGSENFYDDVDVKASKEGFIAGAKWQAEQLLKSSPLSEDTVLFNKGVAEGRRLMMEELSDHIAAAYQLGLAANNPNIELKAELIHTTDTAQVDGKELLYVSDKSYKIGWRDCKEQMMKEAVKGEVYLYHSYNREATAIIVDIPKDKLGDKVRIIIVKED